MNPLSYSFVTLPLLFVPLLVAISGPSVGPTPILHLQGPVTDDCQCESRSNQLSHTFNDTCLDVIDDISAGVHGWCDEDECDHGETDECKGDTISVQVRYKPATGCPCTANPVLKEYFDDVEYEPNRIDPMVTEQWYNKTVGAFLFCGEDSFKHAIRITCAGTGQYLLNYNYLYSCDNCAEAQGGGGGS